MKPLFLIVLFVFLSVFAIECVGDDDDDNDSSTDDDQTGDNDAAMDDDATDDDQTSDDDAVDDDMADDDAVDDDMADDDAMDDDQTDDDTVDDDSDEYDSGFHALPPNNEIGVFVSAEIGNNAQPGTMDQPVATINRGIELAAAQNKVVFVARGEYVEGVDSPISLFGGYDEWSWQRNLETNITTIRAPFGKHTVLQGGTQTNPQILEGFHLIGGTKLILGFDAFAFASAVEIAGGWAVLDHNRITSGVAIAGLFSSTYLTGIHVSACHTAWIHHNTLEGGLLLHPDEGPNCSTVGIEMTADRGRVRIAHNIIAASTAENVIGVEVRAGHALMNANHVVVGFSDQTGFCTNAVYVGSGATLTAINNFLCVEKAISLYGAVGAFGSTTLIGNTIVSRNKNQHIGVYANNTVNMVNNIIWLGSGEAATGIYREWNGNLTLVNNDIYLTRPGRLVGNRDFSVSTLEQLAQCQWPGCEDATDNLDSDPEFFTADDYHLANESPCIDAGIDPSPWYSGKEIYTDIDGNHRPFGADWDIGMDEYIGE